jgi:hypothetical protein
MRSDLTRPELPDTPEMFDRIEGNLRAEASRIRDFHLARRNRRRWFEHLRPAMTAGAAIAAAAVLLPLTQAVVLGPGDTTPASIVGTAAEAAPTGAAPVDLRLPSAYLDVNLIDGSGGAIRIHQTDRLQMIPEDDRSDMDPGSFA